jgi:hypothetical protein
MTAVHSYAVRITWLRWEIIEQTSKSFEMLQRQIGDTVLPALKRFADELAKLDLDGEDEPIA